MQVYICSNPRMLFGDNAPKVTRDQAKKVTDVVFAQLRGNLPPAARIRFAPSVGDWSGGGRFCPDVEDAKFWRPHPLIAVDGVKMDYVEHVCAEAGKLFDEAKAAVSGEEN